MGNQGLPGQSICLYCGPPPPSLHVTCQGLQEFWPKKFIRFRRKKVRNGMKRHRKNLVMMNPVSLGLGKMRSQKTFLETLLKVKKISLKKVKKNLQKKVKNMQQKKTC